MKTLTVLATILFTTASFAAKYDYGFAFVNASDLDSLQVKIEDATSAIQGSTSMFVSGVTLLGNAKCGKLLKSDRDEPHYRRAELKQKTSRMVTGVKVMTPVSYSNGAYNTSYQAKISFKCRVK